MKIWDAKLEAMAVKASQYPMDALPEIAFAGRSNVGKSTLLNSFARRKKLAYTSSTPGKTRTVNFYRIVASWEPSELTFEEWEDGNLDGEVSDAEGSEVAHLTDNAQAAKPEAAAKFAPAVEPVKAEFRLVDLPGYGFAKASTKSQNDWARSINEYLAQRPELQEVFLLVDFRHVPTEQDVQMMDWIRASGFSGFVIATKADKVPTTKRRAQEKAICKKLDLDPSALYVYAGNAATKSFGLLDIETLIGQLVTE